MKLLIPPHSGANPMLTGFFFGSQNLEATDLIGFYKPIQPLHNQRYILNCTKGKRFGIGIGIADLNPQNYLFQKCLTCSDINQSLGIHKEYAETYLFPQKTPEDNKILQFSDPQNKDWQMILKYPFGAYRIRGGWREFVKKHELETGDWILFFKAEHRPSDIDRYLVRFAKKKQGEQGFQ